MLRIFATVLFLFGFAPTGEPVPVELIHQWTSPLDATGGPGEEPKADMACSREFTPENEQWFNELINANPQSWPVTQGQSICVSNPPGTPLVLPKPIPGNVTLTWTGS